MFLSQKNLLIHQALNNLKQMEKYLFVWKKKEKNKKIDLIILFWIEKLTRKKNTKRKQVEWVEVKEIMQMVEIINNIIKNNMAIIINILEKEKRIMMISVKEPPSLFKSNIIIMLVIRVDFGNLKTHRKELNLRNKLN